MLSWRDGHTHIYRYTFDPNNPLGGLRRSWPANWRAATTRWAPSKPSIPPPELSGTSPIRAIPASSRCGRCSWMAAANTRSPRARLSSIADFANRGGSFIDTYCPPHDAADPLVCREGATPPDRWAEMHALLALAPLRGSPLVRPRSARPHRRRQNHQALRDDAAAARQSARRTASRSSSTPMAVRAWVRSSDAWGGRRLFFDQLLAQHGFAVLHVDNRGMGGRGRDFEQVC